MIKKENEISRVLDIFKEISSIPHGSGNMGKIADYCTDFAKKLALKYYRDNADNVIIYKGANMCDKDTPVILQGHLDMVCQKANDSNFDFLSDGIEIIDDGEYLRAPNTTLGADNGIAVAMILSLLERYDIPHPPIEAVFTTDEEIGMIGAKKLDTAVLYGKKFINLDSEEDDTVTVSCAGGCDFKATLGITRIVKNTTGIKIKLCGLKGGHSGVEINSHRVNADILAGRFLDYLSRHTDFDIVSIDGGDKPNAIPCQCTLVITSDNPEKAVEAINKCADIVKQEISFNEESFYTDVSVLQAKEYSVLDENSKKELIFSLNCIPNGIMEMSSEIENLVETSLNLGVLSTDENEIVFHSALRSSKQSSLDFLENRLRLFFEKVTATVECFGHYPPWEYKSDSVLREIYLNTYTELFGITPKVEAIHAGLECAVFSSSIKGADCIAIGPNIFDAHTVNERLQISSVEKVYKLLLQILAEI